MRERESLLFTTVNILSIVIAWVIGFLTAIKHYFFKCTSCWVFRDFGLSFSFFFFLSPCPFIFRRFFWYFYILLKKQKTKKKKAAVTTTRNKSKKQTNKQKKTATKIINTLQVGHLELQSSLHLLFYDLSDGVSLSIFGKTCGE